MVNEFNHSELDNNIGNRTLKIISERSIVSDSMSVKADVLDNSVFDVIHNIHDMEEEEDDQNDDMFWSKLHNDF